MQRRRQERQIVWKGSTAKPSQLQDHLAVNALNLVIFVKRAGCQECEATNKSLRYLRLYCFTKLNTCTPTHSAGHSCSHSHCSSVLDTASFILYLSARPGERIARALQRPDCPRAPTRNLSARLSGASICESRPAPPPHCSSCCVSTLNLSLLHHYFIPIISYYCCITHLLLQRYYISISITTSSLHHYCNIIITWLLHR